ncbi:hypothetical protein RhiJN_24671 [Ceratobasidium sp. AG-Ba]|nr:hypothetical protein RhiJN_24671 [Ceratobasidium sp. AG-Ba]
MESSDGLYSRSEDYIGLVGLLNEARHQWVSRHAESSTQKTNQKSSTLASSQRENSDYNATRISYPISPATYRLLQDSQFLYRLANMPEIIPNAYQSILSLMKSSSLDDQGTQPSGGGQDIIQETLKIAYWDQMKEALELEDPKAQIDQLKILYKDLAEASSKFFPPAHPARVLFEFDLAPTTQPLRTATHDMVFLIERLRERCAPIRDEALLEIQEILGSFSAAAVATAARKIISITKLMRNDLNGYILQNASETDARRWVRIQARAKEREAALQISGTREKLEQEWKGYLHVQNAMVSPTMLARRLLETISAPTAASFLPPDARPADSREQNLVPPQFMLSVDFLVKVQDLLQALVIVAALRSLVPLAEGLTENFMTRLWTLIELAILEPNSPSESQVKLVNLQDEVVEAYKASHASGSLPGPTITDSALRSIVSRTLRTEDPVFRLLQKRLISALEAELVRVSSGEVGAPSVLRSGRETSINQESSMRSIETARVRARGFENPVLDKPIVKLLQYIQRVLEWIRFCWDDFVLDQ